MEAHSSEPVVHRHSHSVLLVHLVWATRRRHAVLASTADSWLARVLHHKARAIGCVLVAAGNASDHVHAVVRYPATVCVADIAQRLKGGSSYAWNLARSVSAPRLTWQTGYWAESVTPFGVPSLCRYVARQRAHHGETTTPEAWETVLACDEASPEGCSRPT